VLNSLGRTPVYLQNSPKKRHFFLSILGRNSAVTALAVAVEKLAPVFTPRVFQWKTGYLPFPAAGSSPPTGIILNRVCGNGLKSQDW